jgi:exodeoxyribonuclease V alpha subunit
MQTLIGQIDRVIFDEDTFFIAVLKSGEKVSGHYYESSIEHLKGAAITLKGHFDEHKKHGRTFKFESLTVNQNELFFFLNRVIKGFSKKLTADVIEKFGQEGLIDILDNDIEKLLDVSGIKQKRLEKIQVSWKKYRSMRELGEFLAPYGVSTHMITTIATAMKDVDNPIERIQKNPYVLTNISGIGFKRADEVAMKMGEDAESELRIGAAMDYLLFEQCEQQGNSALAKETLFTLLDDTLCFHNKSLIYESALLTRVAEHSIMIMNSERLSPIRLYDAEKYLYDEFKRRMKVKGEKLVKGLDLFLKESKLTLGEQQLEAVKCINDGSNILSLVGYAGTGKSTTSKTILDLLATKYDMSLIITCALSGIASQRISDTTGYESATIQSLLVKFEDRDSMPFKVVLVDEASMINSSLFARLVRKVDRDAVIIIVGDDAQLPPIGAGNVLSDILSLEITPIVKLTKIYRQSEEQAIAFIANDIRQNMIPQYRATYDDFEFIDVSIENYHAVKSSMSSDEFSNQREKNSHAILSTIVANALKYIPEARKKLQKKEILEYLNFYQVISPMKGGTLGVDNLNTVLQSYFNPKPKIAIKKGDKEFRLMDKVVHLKNENMPSWQGDEFKEHEESKERRIFNGMSGLLFKIEEEDEQLFVYFPNEGIVVQYEYDQLKSHLMLSYALTVHKVQGMEYEVVTMPITFSHYIMHNTKLLYTAITRAKKGCYLIGEGGAFEGACRRVDNLKRDTVMLELGY